MFYRIGEFAKRVGVSKQTLRLWDSLGKLVPQRTEGGQRHYTDADVIRVLHLPISEEVKRQVIYCRVSSPAQKDDLVSQVQAMQSFALARGYAAECIQEVGGGMNFDRPKFMQILKDVISGNIDVLIVAHKDRLARFGFQLVQNLCTTYGCQLIVANQEQLSPQQEMVEDLMSIIHTFSCRLYGLRKYKKSEDLLEARA